jgi:putative ABC transport system permease protein
MLRKRLGFTVIAVLSLAVGIGANTAIFTLVNASILREDLDLVDRPEELLDLFLTTADQEYVPLSYPTVEDLRDGTAGVFSGFAESTFLPVQIDGADGVEGVFVEVVTGDSFPTIGVEALLGRVIGPVDDVAPGGHPVVMLNYGYWQRRFARDPSIIGRELRVNGRAYTIIGIAPADYPGSGRWVETALYVPAAMADELAGEDLLDNRGSSGWFGKARLAPGVTRAQAEAAVAAVAASLDAERPPNWEAGAGFILVPTTDVLLYPPVDPYLRQAAWLLMVVVGLVLLLACANLASFLLARARDRRREIALRLALGASRGALVRQLLTESTLLSVLGGAVGLGLAMWLLRALLAAELPLPVPFTLYVDLDLDGAVLAFTLGISVLAGTALGLVPALQSTRPDVVATLKEDTAGGGQPGQTRWRNGLIITQLTVSLVLLVGAGLFLRNFQQLLAVDPGFGRTPTALMTVSFPANRYTADEAQQLARRLLDRFRALPGVDAVGLTNRLPLSMLGGGSLGFNVDGHAPPPDQDAYRAELASVDPVFFDAAGIPIVAGRPFTDADGPDGPGVVIISETMARRFWPDADAVGRMLRRVDPDVPDLRVVGVAGDVKVQSIGESPTLMMYGSYARSNARGLTFVARTSADPEQTARALLTAGREIDPELLVLETQTMARHLMTSRLAAQLAAFLLSAFAVLALVLSMVGLYGVVSYGVASRIREVGIRMALGATTADITRLLAGSGARLVVVGSAIGLTLSVLLSRLLSSLVFGIETLDALTFVGAPVVLCSTAVVASYLPARRASRTNPVTALRAG